ncbi:MAG: sugar phosphate isomerase/epimerase [Fuerstiella sp.]|nr:sugar phosphate isomerase/epimerase [Fuerstiella sp.]
MPCVNAVSFREYRIIETICRIVRDAGFDSLEVSRPPFYENLKTPETRAAFLRWCESIGLNLYGFDCWVEVEPFDALDETLKEFRRAVDFAADLDLKLIISHDTWGHTNADRTPAEVLSTNVGLFRQVAEMTAGANLKLVFEPHPDTLSMQDSWCIDFIDAVAEGHAEGTVGILYDTCHYGVGQPKSYVQAIETLGRRIRHVHFSDGDCTTYALHLPIGDGCLDLQAVTAALKQIGFDGSLTCDMHDYPLLEDGARRNLEPMRQVQQELGLTA